MLSERRPLSLILPGASEFRRRNLAQKKETGRAAGLFWGALPAPAGYQLPLLHAPLEAPEQLRLITPLFTSFVIENVAPLFEVATTMKPLSFAEVTSTLPAPEPTLSPVSEPRHELAVVPDAVEPVYVSLSVKHDSSCETRLRASDFALASFALLRWLRKLGRAIAARMPMIRITTRSSIRVKPLSSRLRRSLSLQHMGCLLAEFWVRLGIGAKAFGS